MSLDFYFSTPRSTYTDEDFETLKTLLLNDDQLRKYGNNPRLYCILRQSGHLPDLDHLIEKGFSDTSIPLLPTQLPGEFSEKWKSSFIKAQEPVCQTSDLIELFKFKKHKNFLEPPVGFHQQSVIATTTRSRVDVVYTVLDGAKYYARKQYFRREMGLHNRETLGAFENEVKNLKRIEHRHCVTLVASYTDIQSFSIVMSPVADGNLAAFLTRAAATKSRALRSFLPQFFGCLSRALWYIHRQRIHHRDIKPENILVHENKVYLTDFDCSYSWANKDHSTTRTAPSKLTWKWAAPEVLNNEQRVSSAVDIWSLGCVFLEMATVLKGRSNVELERRFMEAPERDFSFYSNMPTVHHWIKELRDIKSTNDLDNAPLDWVEKMLQIDQDDRPSAHGLAEMTALEQNSRYFCCDHCILDDNPTDDGSTSTTAELIDQLAVQNAMILLKNGFDVNSAEFKPTEALKWAVEHGQESLVVFIMQKYPNIHALMIDTPPLHAATKLGHEKIIKVLIENGADVNAVSEDRFKTSALHIAAFYDFESIAQLLISHGADIDAVEQVRGATPLHLAASGGGTRVLSLLLARGANFDIRDRGGLTALHAAVVDTAASAVTLLLDKGLDANVKDGRGHTALAIAASQLNQHIAKLLLDKGADINIKRNGLTMLIEVAEAGNLKIAKFLLDMGIEIDTPGDEFQETALMAAAAAGHKVMVELLLANGADIHKTGARDDNALHAAASRGHTSTAKYLIERGIDVAAKDFQGNTALHHAVQRGHVETIRVLLENGASPHETTDMNQTALHLAVNGGKEVVILLLLKEGADIRAQDDEGRTAIHLACEKGLLRGMQALIKDRELSLDTQDYKGRTGLHYAAHKGSLPLVKLLLEKEANYDIKDNAGYSPLHKAAQANQDSIAQLLIEKGANVDCEDDSGLTPLYVALRDNRERVARLLLNAGAAVDLETDDGLTASHLAARHDRVSLLKLLQEKSVDLERKTSSGDTPLHLAVQYSRKAAVQFLIENDADVEAENNKGERPLIMAAKQGNDATVRLLLAQKADIEHEVDGWTAIHLAALHGHDKIVQLLVNEGVDCDTANSEGDRPIHLAAVGDHHKVVRLLLENGVDVDIKTSYGVTALHITAMRGSERVMRLLIEKEANVNETTESGKTPLSLANEHKRRRLVQMLLENGAEH